MRGSRDSPASTTTPDTRHRQRRLRDRRRHDDPPPRTAPRARGPARARAAGRAEAGRRPRRAREPSHDTVDLAGARHEHQDVPGALRQGTTDRRRDVVEERRGHPAVVGPGRPRGRGAPHLLDGEQGARRPRPPAPARCRRGAPPCARPRRSRTSPRPPGPRAGASRTSTSSARVRSSTRCRSWTSSRTTAATPGRSGSRCRRRRSTPVVTTSTRVAALTVLSPADREPDGAPEGLAQEVGQPAGGRARRDPSRLRDHHPPGERRGDRRRDQGRLAGARAAPAPRRRPRARSAATTSASPSRTGRSGGSASSRAIGSSTPAFCGVRPTIAPSPTPPAAARHRPGSTPRRGTCRGSPARGSPTGPWTARTGRRPPRRRTRRSRAC